MSPFVRVCCLESTTGNAYNVAPQASGARCDPPTRKVVLKDVRVFVCLLRIFALEFRRHLGSHV